MHHVILNDDCTWFWDRYIKDCPEKEPSGERAREYIRQYKGSRLTDYFCNISAQYSFVPSKVMETFEDIYNLKDMDGIPVDFTTSERFAMCHKFNMAGVNVYAEIIDECNKVGIAPWISIRMNDIHSNRQMSPHGNGIRSMFNHRAHAKGLMRDSYRDIVGYYDETLNYEMEEVRNRYLDYIREQVMAYDVAGVELDFLREPYCFLPGHEDVGREIMLEFMKDVRKSCDAAAKKYGHPVKIAVRCLPDPLNDRYSGLYILGAARAGYVDMLIPSPRWETSYDRIPCDMWKELVPEGCLVVPSYEVAHTVSRRPYKRVSRCREQAYGMSHKDLCMGADGVYFYNNIYQFATIDPKHPEFYNIVGDRERLASMPMRFTVSYEDRVALAGQRLQQLPLPLDTEEYSYVYVETGTHNKPLYLLIGANIENEELSLYVNAAKVEYLGKANVESKYSAEPVLVYKVDTLRKISQAVEMHTRKEGVVVSYVEMRTEKPELI